jgi:predicted dehydrogenase
MIGCGTISYYHLKQIQNLDSVKIVAAYNRSKEPRERFGEKAGLRKTNLHSNISKMLEQTSMDAVINCLPNRMHSTISIEAMEAGFHVLCEKPMATSYTEALQMITVAKKNNKKLLIGLTRRFNHQATVAKKIIDTGILGLVYYAKAGWMRRNGIPGWGSQFTQKELAGAGPIYDIGVHALDTTCWLMSDFQAEQVLATCYSRFGPHKRGLGGWGKHDLKGVFNVEDLASAIIIMKSGTTISFEVSWAAHIAKSQFTVQILGDDAGFDLEEMMLYSTTEEEINTPINYKKNDPYLDEMKHFIYCIQEDKPPITKPEEMLELQAILDMILVSSQENRVVKRSEI